MLWKLVALYWSYIVINNLSISLNAGHVHRGKLYHGFKCQYHTRSFRYSCLFPTSWNAETISQTVLAWYVKSPYALRYARWLETALTSVCLVSLSSECPPQLTVDGRLKKRTIKRGWRQHPCLQHSPRLCSSHAEYCGEWYSTGLSSSSWENSYFIHDCPMSNYTATSSLPHHFVF